MKRVLFLGIGLLVSGCVTSENQTAAAEDALLVERMRVERDALVSALTIFEQEPRFATAMCHPGLCADDPVACQWLGNLASNPDRLDFVRSTLLSPTELARVRTALATLDLRATSNPSEVTFEGVVQDALTVGARVVANTPRFSRRASAAVRMMVGHEVGHALGRLDRGVAVREPRTIPRRFVLAMRPFVQP